MNDSDMSAGNGRSRIGWFAGGALAVAVAVGLFLYADGYFETQDEVAVDMPKVIIEGD